MYRTLTDARVAAQHGVVSKFIDVLYIIYVPEDKLYDVVTDEQLDTYYLGLEPVEMIE